jgi:hypothetical protein
VDGNAAEINDKPLFPSSDAFQRGHLLFRLAEWSRLSTMSAHKSLASRAESTCRRADDRDGARQ